MIITLLAYYLCIIIILLCCCSYIRDNIRWQTPKTQAPEEDYRYYHDNYNVLIHVYASRRSRYRYIYNTIWYLIIILIPVSLPLITHIGNATHDWQLLYYMKLFNQFYCCGLLLILIDDLYTDGRIYSQSFKYIYEDEIDNTVLWYIGVTLLIVIYAILDSKVIFYSINPQLTEPYKLESHQYLRNFRNFIYLLIYGSILYNVHEKYVKVASSLGSEDDTHTILGDVYTVPKIREFICIFVIISTCIPLIIGLNWVFIQYPWYHYKTNNSLIIFYLFIAAYYIYFLFVINVLYTNMKNNWVVNYNLCLLILIVVLVWSLVFVISLHKIQILMLYEDTAMIYMHLITPYTPYTDNRLGIYILSVILA